MNIAVLLGREPPHGGAETANQARRIATLLAKRDHDVTMITRGRPEWENDETAGSDGVTALSVAPRGPLGAAVFVASALNALRRLKSRPDVTLCLDAGAGGRAGALADAMLVIPPVIWVRGESAYRHADLYHAGLPAPWVRRRARLVLVPTPGCRQALLRHLRSRNALEADRLAPRLDVMPDGISVPEQPFPPGEDWLWVGRLAADQGVEDLLEALARLAIRGDRRSLWLVGEGPEQKRLERYADRLGVDAIFAGPRSREGLTEFYRRARALILPRQPDVEIQGTLLEAMGHGVPAVAPDTGDYRELLPDQRYLVSPGVPQLLAEALATLGDLDERDKAARKARARAERRAWPRVIERLETFLLEAAATSGRVWLVSPKAGTRGGVAAVARQVLVSRLGRRWRLVSVPIYEAGSMLRRLFVGSVGLLKVSSGLIVRKPDLVHLKVASRGSFTRKLAVAGLCRLRGVPILVHVHGGGFDEFIATSPFFVRRLASWMLNASPVVLALSAEWSGRLRRHFPEANIEVLPNPVEVSRYADLLDSRRADRRANSRPKRVLFLGDLSQAKGVHDLIQAWPKVMECVPSATLTLAGSGNIRQMRSLAESNGVAAWVRTPGWVGEDEKRRLLADADLFVLPSYIEGVPISLLEAMAAGLPSVVTPVGGVPDVVQDGVESVMVSPGRPAELAEAIGSLLRDEERAQDLGAAAQERVRAFDLTEYSRRLDEIYARVLRHPAPKPVSVQEISEPGRGRGGVSR